MNAILNDELAGRDLVYHIVKRYDSVNFNDTDTEACESVRGSLIKGWLNKFELKVRHIRFVYNIVKL